MVGGVSSTVEPITTFGFLGGQSTLSVIFLLRNGFNGPFSFRRHPLFLLLLLPAWRLIDE